MVSNFKYFSVLRAISRSDAHDDSLMLARSLAFGIYSRV